MQNPRTYVPPLPRVTFIGEEVWSEFLTARLSESPFNQRLDCSHLSMASGRGFLISALGSLLRSDCVVRVGFIPPRIPPRKRLDGVGPPSFRERTLRMVVATPVGRAARTLLHIALQPAATRRRFIFHWMQTATRPLRPKRKDIHYWIGSDVLTICERAAGSDISAREWAELRAMRNIAGADHLAAELAAVGIDAESVPFPGALTPPPQPAPPLPALMTVVSYVPEGRRDFYGLPGILDAARSLPTVRFRIFGGTANGVPDIPANVSFLGYVDDVGEVYANATVVVRHIAHDSVGGTVIEGLSYARHVIYTYDLPHTIRSHFDDPDSLTAALSELNTLHDAGRLQSNTEGRRWAMVEFDPHRRLMRLASVLTSG